MHRAALPLGNTGGLPEQLGHHAPRLRAEGDGVGVIAIAGEEDVLLLQRRDDAAGHRFLAAVDVQVSADLALAELTLGGLLEAANEDHLPEDVSPLRRARGRRI